MSELPAPEILAALIGGVFALAAAAISAWAMLRSRRQRTPQDVYTRRAGERRYRVEGMNEDGTPYAGVAFLKIRGARCHIREVIGEEEFVGEGEFQEDHLTMMLGPHLVTYHRSDNGELSGSWGAGGTERLIPE